MATVPKKVCDLCRTDNDVDECVVVYRYERGKPWGVDLCRSCFHQRFGDLQKKSHPVRRANIRPQYRVIRTDFPDEVFTVKRPERD